MITVSPVRPESTAVIDRRCAPAATHAPASRSRRRSARRRGFVRLATIARPSAIRRRQTAVPGRATAAASVDRRWRRRRWRRSRPRSPSASGEVFERRADRVVAHEELDDRVARQRRERPRRRSRRPSRATRPRAPSSRITRRRLDPSASRTASSCRRDSARAKTSAHRLAAAITSTSAGDAEQRVERIRITVRKPRSMPVAAGTDPRRPLEIVVARRVQELFRHGGVEERGPHRLTCARADSIVTPGARRPMVRPTRGAVEHRRFRCMIDGSRAIGTITSCSIVTLKPRKSFWRDADDRERHRRPP